ncbi:MAG: urate oxidase [Chloroflexi bacterium]|nr:MAG: urate oxidase [Chloroflexota bacterium]
MKHEIGYGKHEISFYRAHATPLSGVEAIAESSFTGRSNLLLAGVATMDVLGDNFLPAYTEGDNTDVVATDTMKNFVYAMALEYTGATTEGLAAFLARRFLDTYQHVRGVRVRIEESPFRDLSDKLLAPAGGDRGMASVELSREGVVDVECGRLDMRLIKLTGSAFAAFQRDRYTTLPEVQDRPLHVYLGVRWRYRDPEPALAGTAAGLVPSEQVRDLVTHTFDDFVSMSIQHLVHEMGVRLLERFSALAEVSFDAQNRLWDTSGVSEDDPQVRVFSDPKPAHGHIALRLQR